MRFAALACLLVAFTLLYPAASVRAAASVIAPDFLWWEGEAPSRTNFPARHAFEPANPTEAAKLSEGRWLGADGDWGGKLFAEYDLTVPEAGVWKLYARKFWKHGPFNWTLGGHSGTVTRDVALMDATPIRQFLEANWVYLGDVELPAGPATLRIETLETSGAIAFDAFLLTRTPLQPRGKLKPGEKWNRAEEGFFPFEPDRDPYLPTPLSLRHLNEEFAGQRGWIRAQGTRLVQGDDDRPVRLWAVNTGWESVRKDRAAIDEQARFWAKRGINMVRLHGGIWRDDDFTQVDLTLLDQIHYYVAAMKREGIYTKLSTYFPLWIRFDDNTPGFPGYRPGGQHPFAIQFFNPRFQEIQRNWFRTLLTTPNPYADGVPLGQDPAVAIVEIVNEDSYFFWTFTPYENVPAPQMELLEKQFGQWLSARHGSLQQALSALGNQRVRGDDVAAGRAGFMPLWEMFNSKSPRAQAQAEFLATHQRDYFRSMDRFLKQDLGYRGLVTASNWTVADPRTLMPLEKWSNALDLLDRHGYWSGPHEGERAGYSISPGDRFADRSALLGPQSTPLYETQWMDLPSIISEVNWTPPNRFRAEFTPLAALYLTLQGNDGIFFFATAEQGFGQTLPKFAISTPAVAGQWPAAAHIYRRQLVDEAGTALRINARLADLFALKGTPVATSVNLDMNRFANVPPAQAAADEINPLYFLVGRVETAITDAGAPTTGVDLSRFVDPDARTVTSMTGQLTWDFGRGIVTVHAPRANGAVGFLGKQGRFDLPVLRLGTPMEFASVLLVPLDDQPLETSRQMLLQVMTEERPFGFAATPPDDKGLQTITSLGAAPLTVRKIDATLTLRRSDADQLRITPLDFNGYPTAEPQPLTPDFKLDPTTIYYVIERER